MDWDRIMQNSARGTGFTGRGAADEQAYFEAFAEVGETTIGVGKLKGLRHLAIVIVGFFSVEFMLR